MVDRLSEWGIYTNRYSTYAVGLYCGNREIATKVGGFKSGSTFLLMENTPNYVSTRHDLYRRLVHKELCGW